MYVPGAWVYMLRCADGSLYTGWTTDVQRRLAQHRAGKASRYTASRLPVELAFVAPMADRPAARREEARIKALDRAAKLALIAAADVQRRYSPPLHGAHCSLPTSVTLIAGLLGSAWITTEHFSLESH
jgi:putative endonuclease